MHIAQRAGRIGERGTLAEQGGEAERGAGRRLDAARERIRNQIRRRPPRVHCCDERSALAESVAGASGTLLM